MRLAQAMALAIVSFLAVAPAWAQAPAGSTASGAPAGGDAQNQLQRIMEQPLYQRWRLRQERLNDRRRETGDSEFVKAIRLAMGELWDWIKNMIDGIVRSMPKPSVNWSLGDLTLWQEIIRLVGWTMLAVVVILLAFLGYRAFRQAQPAWAGGRVLSREQVREALREGEALALAAPEWLGEAQRLALQRDARAVYRALYLALLSGLHDAGKIDFRRNRTNWVYVNRFKGPQDQRGMFEKLTEMFDQVWYGQKPADAEGIEQVRSDVSALIGKGQADA